MIYTRSWGRNLAAQVLVVLGLTLLALVLGAILLPPKGSSAMPRGGTGEVPSTVPR